MTRHVRIPYLVALLAILLSACASTESDRPEGSSARPNIVFIFTDDQGWGDVAAYGHPDVQTPNMDALASNGVLSLPSSMWDPLYARLHGLPF